MSDDVDEPYEVGYRKPPKATQFKPGRSGNPKGRKPRNTTVKAALTEKLNQKLILKNGTTTTARDLIIDKGIHEMASGIVRQWPQTFEFLAQFDPKQKFTPTADDEERLRRLIGEISNQDGDDGEV